MCRMHTNAALAASEEKYNREYALPNWDFPGAGKPFGYSLFRTMKTSEPLGVSLRDRVIKSGKDKTGVKTYKCRNKFVPQFSEVKYPSYKVSKQLELLMRNVSMKVNQRAPLNAFEVNSLQARIQFTTKIVEAFQILSGYSYQLDSNEITHFKYATMLIKKMLGNLEFISTQQHSDFSNECLRFQLIIQLYVIKSMPQIRYLRDVASLKNYKECESLISSLKPFPPNLYDETYIKLEQLQKTLGTPIGISKVEMKSIVKAINLHQGHWYTCPNGHVYVIGECGQAMQESRCNECGERIGGGGHRHLPTNTRLQSFPDGL